LARRLGERLMMITHIPFARALCLGLLLAYLGFSIEMSAEEGAPEAAEQGEAAKAEGTRAEASKSALELKVVDSAGKDTTISSSIKIVLLMTMLSLAPALLVLMTSFTRIVIVLSFVRQAMATQQLPPNIVLIGLSLFLTMFIMTPVWQQVYSEAYQPYMKGELDHEQALTTGLKPMREFMAKQTRKKDLALFIELSNAPRPEKLEDVPTVALVPAFVISELKTAFQMGFLVFLPFIVIDLIVSSILMSLGMVMLPPAMIALPMKILLFVLADGWQLLTRALVASFGTVG
jgi:flagellar biosynthetic protein FliP